MFMRTLTLALAFGVLAAGPPAAEAQIACGERARIVGQLDRTYGEARKGMGLAGRQTLFELWVSETTGTWTILATHANGTTCIMAAGDHWQDEPRPFTPALRP